MAEQLTILGLWERLDSADPPTLPTLTPPSALPVPVPVDPRQQELLSGAHLLRAKIEAACLALDAEAVRVAHAELVAQFTHQSWAAKAPAWVDALAWLKAATSVDEFAQRTQLLDEGRLPGMTPALFKEVRSEALKAAAHRLVAERGARAALSDGRPAGYLALMSGDEAGGARRPRR